MNKEDLKTECETLLRTLSITDKKVEAYEDPDEKKIYSYCTLLDFEDYEDNSSEISLWCEIGCESPNGKSITKEDVVYSFCLERDQEYFGETLKDKLKKSVKIKYADIFDEECYEIYYKERKLYVQVYIGPQSAHNRIYVSYSIKKENCDIATELKFFLKLLKEKGNLSSDELLKMESNPDLMPYMTEIALDTTLLLDAVKSKMMASEQIVKLLENRAKNPSFLQYVPFEGSFEEWEKNKCHYEFEMNGNFVNVAFHSEGGFPYRKQLADFILKDSELSSKAKEWGIPGAAVIFDSIKIENSTDYVAEKSVQSMLDAEKKYGVLIQNLITKSKDAAMVENKIDNYKALLENNHNIILHGAPGTGKTYLAKEIASEMIFGKSQKDLNEDESRQLKEQTDFVQFHQSYDYTDFVEGLRPVDKNGTVGFERKNGAFKEFCKKAFLANQSKNSSEITFAQAYEDVLKKIEQEEIQSFTQKTGVEIYVKEISSQRNIYLQSSEEASKNEQDQTAKHPVSFNRLNKLYEKFSTVESVKNISNIDKDIKGVIGGCNSSAYWAVLNSILSYKESYKKSASSTSNKFVFIIDEINRGEMSKIFGELFFSVDPGYRGADDRVKTQYQSLVPSSDVFANGFFVPENVYIIGTMNDIDRSVESMDFAMRRRFAFKEVKASERVEMLRDSKHGIGTYADEAEKRMNALNVEIEKVPGLSSAYHIGPAYFLKLKNYVEADKPFERLWEYHIEGLVREYLRGIDPNEKYFKKLENAYLGNEENTKETSANEAEG